MMIDREQLQKALAQEIRDELLKENYVYIDGIGLFSLKHHPAEEESRPDGTILLHPPKDKLAFDTTHTIKSLKSFNILDKLSEKLPAQKNDLEEVINLVLKEVKELLEGEEIKYEGWGLFKKENNALIYIPDPVFELEINYEYAGLQPIVLLEGYGSSFALSETTITPTSSDRDTADKSVYETLINEFHTENESVDTPPVNLEKELAFDKKEIFKSEEIQDSIQLNEFSSDAGKIADDLEQEFKTQNKETIEGQSIVNKEGALERIEDQKSNETDINTSESNKADSIDSKETAKLEHSNLELDDNSRKNSGKSTPTDVLEIKVDEKETKREAKKGKSVKISKFSTMALVAATLVAAIITVLYFSDRNTQSSSTDLVVVTTTNNEEMTVNGISDPSIDLEGETTIENQGLSFEETMMSTNPMRTNVNEFGLNGTFDLNITLFSAIIIASLTDEDKAKEQALKLASMGYRTHHYMFTLPDRRSTWRVVVGQFENTVEATEAASELPVPYRNNFFIANVKL